MSSSSVTWSSSDIVVSAGMTLSKYVLEDVEGVQVSWSRAYTWNNVNQVVRNKEILLLVHLQWRCQHNAYGVDVPEALQVGVTTKRG